MCPTTLSKRVCEGVYVSRKSRGRRSMPEEKGALTQVNPLLIILCEAHVKIIQWDKVDAELKTECRTSDRDT